jgi:DNA processing protein
MAEAALYNIATGLLPGIGNMLTRQLVSYLGGTEAIFTSLKGSLLKVPGVGATTADAIMAHRQQALSQASPILEKATKRGDRVIFYTDADYPSRLRAIDDAPTLLFMSGRGSLEADKVVSIVGTRQATDYGRQFCQELITGLVKHRALIVSGLAYGIDIAAHRAAVQAGLPTIGVMASGLDIIYPHTHKKTADEMLALGGLLSEHPHGTQADAHNFPARNRIIAGLADVVIIVEAQEKGGALITAEIAHGYNKDVFAVPGSVYSPASAGCNKLLARKKAEAITGIADLEYAMSWDLEANGQPAKAAPLQLDLFKYGADEQAVLQQLQAHPDLHIDELSRASLVPLNKLAGVLLALEFEGVVRTMPGKKFALARR